MRLFGSKKTNVATAPEKQTLQETPAVADEQTSQEDPTVADELSRIEEAIELLGSVDQGTANKQETKSTAAPAKEEKKRQRDRSLYNALLAGLYDAVLIVDKQGNVIGSNARCDTSFGYEEGEIWGIDCSELISNINMRMLTKIQAYACEGRFTVVTTKCRRKDGSSFPAEIAISQINLLQEGDLIFSIRNNERREKAKGRKSVEKKALKYTSVGIAVCTLKV